MPSPLERVRKICLALPGSEEKLSHSSQTFFVKKRVFAYFLDNHHNDGRVALWCNAPEGVQRALVEADPVQYFVPPYVGPGGWIGVRLDKKPDWKSVAGLIAQAHAYTVAKASRKRHLTAR